jgi:hypothetical protein
MRPSARFPISFDPSYALVSRGLLISPNASYVEIGSAEVAVRMAWAFRATFDRSAIAGASILPTRIPLTRGVHGWAGRWLVNGAGDGIVTIDFEPSQRAYVMGFPVKLRQLQVSVDTPAGLAKALAA